MADCGACIHGERLQDRVAQDQIDEAWRRESEPGAGELFGCPQASQVPILLL